MIIVLFLLKAHNIGFGNSIDRLATLENALNMLAASFILHKVAESPAIFSFLGETRTEDFRDPYAWIRIEKEDLLPISSPTQISSDLFEQVMYFRPIRPDRSTFFR